MSIQPTYETSNEEARKAAIEDAKEHRDSIERLANSDLPYAPYAQNLLDFLEEVDE